MWENLSIGRGVLARGCLRGRRAVLPLRYIRGRQKIDKYKGHTGAFQEMSEDVLREEDENTIGAVRYPCMPSLVALQQMRNRLHLAYLGRKLMKWTALATGRELRRLAVEIHSAFCSFGEDLSNAFMLLARGRYFYPNLNKMVLENVPNRASVVVTSSFKAVSGVKVLQYEIIESGAEPYEHLGIEKGGQKIHEAKLAWLNLLKRLVLMLELRTSFALVEVAHKNATKRMNVMIKVVIPRTQETTHYILLELEERAREELFRIKMIKKKKAKLADIGDKVDVELCPICKEPTEYDTKKAEKRRSRIDLPQVAHEHITKLTELIPRSEVTPKPTPLSTPPQTLQSVLKQPVTPQIHQKADPNEIPQNAESTKDMHKPRLNMTEHDCTKLLPAKALDTDNRLEYLKKLLIEIINIGKDMVGTGANQANMEEFLKTCEEAKSRIDNFIEVEEEEVDPNLKDRLLHLKLHLREVIDLTQSFRKETLISTSMEHFIETCEEVDEKLDVYMKSVESKPITDDTKTKLLNLQEQIKDVVQMTEDYTLQGLLTPSVEEFVKTCASVQIKINEYVKDPEMIVETNKLNHLKAHVGQLEKLTTDIKQGGLASTSLEKFLSSCKDFKMKLEDSKRAKKLRATFDSDLDQLVNLLDKTIDLSIVAKREGLIDESFEELVECCENIKSLFETKEDEEERPQTLAELKMHIENVLKLVTNLKTEGLITASVEDFLRTCENTKVRINVYEKYPLSSASKIATKSPRAPCSETCTCEDFREQPINDEEEVCANCKKMLEEPLTPVLPFAVEPCDSCRGIIKLEELEEYPCESCAQILEPNVCAQGLKNKDDKERREQPIQPPEPPPKEPTPPPSPVDSSLGYFEKKIRKIKRVTRTLNPDGTIREETQTIIIRKSRHDPTETSLIENDDDDGDAADFEDIPDANEDEKLCLLCAEMNQTLGFIRNTQSEGVFRLPRMAVPNLRQCISEYINDMFRDDGIQDSDEVVTSLYSFGNF